MNYKLLNLLEIIYYNTFLLNDYDVYQCIADIGLTEIGVNYLIDKIYNLLYKFNVVIDKELLFIQLASIHNLIKNDKIPIINFINYYKQYKIDINKKIIHLISDKYIIPHFNSYIYNNKLLISYIVLLHLLQVGCFIYIYNIQNMNNYYYEFTIISRTSALCILINTCISLLMYCDLSNFISTKINLYLLHNSKLIFHYIVGIEIIIYSFIHAISHIIYINLIINKCNIQCDINKIPLLLKLNITNISNFTIFQYNTIYIGYVLLCLLCIFLLIIFLKFRLSLFIFCHKLIIIIFIILTVIHGYKQILSFNYSYILLIPAFIFYLYIRRRELGTYFYTPSIIYDYELTNDNYIILKLYKDKLLDESLYSGTIYYLYSKNVSKYEWHPFTSSSTYENKFVTFNIHITGKWTKNLYTELHNNNLYKLQIGRYKYSLLNLYIYYPINIFICVNLGITPYISIIRDLIYNSKKENQIHYFIWIINDLSLIKLYSYIFNQVSHINNLQNINIQIYYSNKFNFSLLDLNIKNLIIYNFIQYLIHKNLGVDILCNEHLPSPIIIGKFDISNLLKKIIYDNININIGVFICAKDIITNIMLNKCNTYSNNKKKVRFDCYKV